MMLTLMLAAMGGSLAAGTDDLESTTSRGAGAPCPPWPDATARRRTRFSRPATAAHRRKRKHTPCRPILN